MLGAELELLAAQSALRLGHADLARARRAVPEAVIVVEPLGIDPERGEGPRWTVEGSERRRHPSVADLKSVTA